MDDMRFVEVNGKKIPLKVYLSYMNRKQKRKFLAEMKQSDKSKKQKLTRSDTFSIPSTETEGEMNDTSVEEISLETQTPKEEPSETSLIKEE